MATAGWTGKPRCRQKGDGAVSWLHVTGHTTGAIVNGHIGDVKCGAPEQPLLGSGAVAGRGWCRCTRGDPCHTGNVAVERHGPEATSFASEFCVEEVRSHPGYQFPLNGSDIWPGEWRLVARPQEVEEISRLECRVVELHAARRWVDRVGTALHDQEGHRGTAKVTAAKAGELSSGEHGGRFHPGVTAARVVGDGQSDLSAVGVPYETDLVWVDEAPEH